MSLLDVQRSLVGLTRGSMGAYENALQLTPDEQEWLTQILDSKGLQVTQQIQQWWRMSRVCSTAPLTIELLKRNGLTDLIVEYITNQPVRTLFFAAELEQFKQFLETHAQVDTTTKTLIAFEAGIKAATQLASANLTTQTFSLSLKFEQNPLELFTALLTGMPLPPADPQGFQLVVDSTLETLWRCYRNDAISLYSLNEHVSAG
ncbi:hypothetical protein [Cellvibrio sp.]|jgi:hypothetical protein